MNNCTAQGNRAQFGRFLSDSVLIWDQGIIPPKGWLAINSSILDNGGNEFDLNHIEFLDVRFTNIYISEPYFHDYFEALKQGIGNRCLDPRFVSPGYWDDLETPEDPNDDIFIAGDYHLKSQTGRWNPITETWVIDDITSLCIDAGDPNSPIGLEPLPNGSRINMGAYGGTFEASLSYPIMPIPEPNMPEPTNDPNEGGGGGGGR